ncbi:MAG: RagB/SusD family nutrient uptake outer membrane protein [Rikenellaceae bacterium]
MKRTLKYIAVLSLTFFLASCGNDWLDLKKDDSFSSTQKLKTKDLVSMQIGMYNAIQGSSDYYGARMIYDGDVRADDFQYKESGSGRADDSFLYAYDLNNAVGCWKDAYYLIKTASSIIEAKPVDADKNEKVVNDIKGQAYFMRAIAHLDLLRNYGEFYDVNSKWGVPIINRVIPGGELASNKPARNTVKEVYDQIVEDLVGEGKAIALMADKKAVDGFANAWSAKALLCRVYLYMGENKKCLDVANDIITNSPYQLWKNDEYLSAWTKRGNSEILFEIVNNTEDNVGREAIGYLMYPTGGNGYGDVVATLQYTNLFQDGDVRKGLFFEDEDAKPTNTWVGKKIFMYKYPGVDKSASGTGNDNMTASIPVLRLSEVYLNGAEAAQKLGDAKADGLLTAIVQRANPKAPAVSGANLERVLLERRLELGGEGFRFYDALRNDKTMYRDNVAEYMKEVDASGVKITQPETVEAENAALHPSLASEYLSISRASKKIILPIPAREINVINSNSTIIEQYYKW